MMDVTLTAAIVVVVIVALIGAVAYTRRRPKPSESTHPVQLGSLG